MGQRQMQNSKQPAGEGRLSSGKEKQKKGQNLCTTKPPSVPRALAQEARTTLADSSSCPATSAPDSRNSIPAAAHLCFSFPYLLKPIQTTRFPLSFLLSKPISDIYHLSRVFSQLRSTEKKYTTLLFACFPIQ